MEMSNRQKELLLDIIGGSNSLPQLVNSPTFSEVTERTIQRDLSELSEAGIVTRSGEARGTVYSITPSARINIALPEERLERIFVNDDRPSVPYDFGRLDVLRNTPVFTQSELSELDHYNGIFFKKLQYAPEDIIRREQERIIIELSWKSSQIEGNTYTLLETESLIKDGIPAAGKTQEETTMVMNHKKALDFTEKHQEEFADNIDFQTVIELHKIIGEALGISEGLREGLIGITGSTYKPLDNKYQIEDELRKFCEVVNSKENVFEKALIAFTYLCYLQPFNDGNKRTARILANAIL
jgi:Fic family protein